MTRDRLEAAGLYLVTAPIWLPIYALSAAAGAFYRWRHHHG